MLRLSYTALSPFCRKVRMAMEWMELEFEIFDSCDVRKYPAFNPRAEVPLLEDGATSVRNSATIVDYLHVRFPGAPSLLPRDPRAFATCKEWELVADTMLDPIVTNCAIFRFGDLPEPPVGLEEAAAADLAEICRRLDAALECRDHVAGKLSVADFALYPHLLAAQRIGLGAPIAGHANVTRWLRAMMTSPVGKADLLAVRKWWDAREDQDVETDRINWGTYRLEWFLAHGFHDWFYREIERDAVLWSVGPRNNALNSPLHPGRAA